MVKDLESLIEYLYLLSIKSELLKEKCVVNPTSSKQCLGKVVIFNKVLPSRPDCSIAIKVIDRGIDRYDVTHNSYIRALDINYLDKILVRTDGGKFYFSNVPSFQLSHPCFEYLDLQLSLDTLHPLTEVTPVLKP